MRKKFAVISILFVALMLLSFVSVDAWVYPDCIEDERWELWGPRADRLLIKLYEGVDAEFMALEGHEIDFTDLALTPTWKEKLCTPPESEYIKCVSYGPDYGIRVLDMNNNGSSGWPRVPCVTREPAMRRAIAHLCDKERIVMECVAGQGFPLYSLLGPGWAKYQHPEIRPGGLLEDLAYLYNWESARQTLIDDPNFQFVAGPGTCPPPCSGTAISDYGDHLEWYVGEADEWQTVCLDFFIRSDDPERKCAGDIIADELEHCLGACVNRHYGDSTTARIEVMTMKDFNLYTGGWGLSYDPDWMWWLYHIDWYWSGRALNYGRVNCPEFNYWSYILVSANTQEEAVEAAIKCQEAMASPDCVGVVPLWEQEGITAYHRTYIGTPGVPDGEDKYEGKNWLGVVNEMGTGIPCWETYLNAHPEGHEVGDCENMTIRWGFRVPRLLAFNPMYSEWWYDYNVLDLIYDSLLIQNPYDLSEWMPYIAKSYEIGTYANGTKTYVDFYLRDDVYWSDGVQFTTTDVEFSLHSCEFLLAAKGCSWPWFSATTWPVVNVTIYDNFYCRAYLIEKGPRPDEIPVSRLWALHAIGGSIMIPKHIWEPLIQTKTCDQLEGWGPDLDPNMVGTGPYKFVEYVEESHVLLEKNPKYFLFDDMELYIPHPADMPHPTDMQSYVGVINRATAPATVSVTLEYESSPGVWITIRTKSVTVPAKTTDVCARKGVSFESELETAGLLGQTGVKFRCTASAPIRGVTVTRIRITHATRPGDINSDNTIGLGDAILLTKVYATPTQWFLPEDINLDGSIGLLDAVLLSTHYGVTSP